MRWWGSPNTLPKEVRLTKLPGNKGFQYLFLFLKSVASRDGVSRKCWSYSSTACFGFILPRIIYLIPSLRFHHCVKVCILNTSAQKMFASWGNCFWWTNALITPRTIHCQAGLKDHRLTVCLMRWTEKEKWVQEGSKWNSWIIQLNLLTITKEFVDFRQKLTV